MLLFVSVTFFTLKIICLVMKRKLTLRLDDSLIKRAKRHAKRKGASVPQMVADYFALIETEEFSSVIQELPPVTASLVGILKNKNRGEEDYKKQLENQCLT